MARDRSRSRERDEKRHRSPARRRERSPAERSSRESRRSPHQSRNRSRSRSPHRRYKEREDRRSRSPKQTRERDYEHRERSRKDKYRDSSQKIDLESVATAEDDMMKMMGFGGFDTTKNKKVEGNIDGMAKVNKPRKFRQYMNRKGGFNRPLDQIR